MPVHMEMFPPVVLEIQRELENHPMLTSILRPDMTLEERVGHIAAYCNVVLDGYYDDKDLEALFTMLLGRLKKKSAIIIH